VHQIENQLAILATMKPAGPTTSNAKLVDPTTTYPTWARLLNHGHALQGDVDLIVFALATDLTRVFSYMFSCAACRLVCRRGAGSRHHFTRTTGTARTPKGMVVATAGFLTGVQYAMSNLNDTLTRMMNCADGAGNLLDNSAV